MIPRLKETLIKQIQPALKEQFGLKNIFMAPKIEKIVLNMGNPYKIWVNKIRVKYLSHTNSHWLRSRD